MKDIEWSIDTNLLDEHIQEYSDHRHARLILEQVKLWKLRVLECVYSAEKYLNELGVITCWAEHEFKCFDPLDCDNRSKNMSCLHWLELRYIQSLSSNLKWDPNRPLNGRDVFGIMFFTIAYLLFQKWYTHDWYIPFDQLKSLNDKSIKLDWSVWWSVTQDQVKEHQTAHWEFLNEEYKREVIDSMRNFRDQLDSKLALRNFVELKLVS